MDFFDNNYYRLNKVLMSIIGQWPYQSKNQRIIISTFLIIMNVTMMSAMISGVIISDNFDDTINILTAIFVGLTCGSKILNSIINSKKMRCLLEQIKSDWMLVSGAEVHILKEFARRGRLLSLVYEVYVYCSLSAYLINAYAPQLLNIVKPLNESRPRRRTYQSNYFIDEEKYYYQITIHEHLASLLNITTLLTIDSMYVVYTEHVCGMFAVLRYRLENILKNKEGVEDDLEILESSSFKENDESTKAVLLCIYLHQNNIEYAKKLDSAFSASLFFQMGIGMVTLSITGYVTVLKLGVLDEFMQFFPYTIGQIIYIFYNCLPGEKLMNYSEDIISSVYNSQWYKMPLKTQKLFILLMVRSSRPCKLQAGGVFILSLKTFSSCIQKSFSYFTVLLSMQG